MPAVPLGNYPVTFNLVVWRPLLPFATRFAAFLFDLEPCSGTLFLWYEFRLRRFPLFATLRIARDAHQGGTQEAVS